MQHHIYDTSYALSTGITIRKLREPICPDATLKGAVFLGHPYYSTIQANRWHATRSEAIADAEAQRKRKIVSVEKQLEKLRAMTFDAPELPMEDPDA